MLYERNVRYKDEKCNNLIEQEVDGNTSLTFILCVSVAGAVEFIFANITPTWHGKIVKQCCRNERGC